MRYNCSGRSMIEMLGVLAIIGVLSIGGIAGYSKMMMRLRINKVLEQVGVMSSKLSAYGSQANSYKGLTNDTAIKLGAATDDMISNGNPFGGDIVIKAGNLIKTGTDKQAYVIIYKDIPEEACISIVSGERYASKNSSFLGLGAGSTSKATTIEKKLYQGCDGSKAAGQLIACAEGKTVAMPVDISDATTGCTCANKLCAVVFKYY
ncbi:MAG: type II secretion system protein [Alphaproteobacteria bacterium]|nr:type II secretion system protein [Alphaproteobacteria bacterium]